MIYLLIIFLFGCSHAPDYKKAIDECKKIRSEEGYDFIGYEDVSEFHKGKQEGLSAGYFYGCVDSKIKEQVK